MRKKQTKLKAQLELVILTQTPVKLLRPRNIHQANYINSLCNNTITIANGPAGTGKTYLAAAKAIDMLQANIISHIIITRPYVPAGEKLGFIPGTIEEKFAPYLEPYLDTFIDKVGKQTLNAMLTDGRIQAKPISFLQGKTFNDAIILVDEAENASLTQLKLILTRMGEGCRAVLMGDPQQTYIHNSGFTDAIRILKNVPRLQIIEFDINDVVRSDTCRHILEAFELAA